MSDNVVQPEPPHAQHDFGSPEKQVREQEIVPSRPTKVSPAMYSLVRRLIQLQRKLQGRTVVEVTIELEPDNIYLTQTRFFERVPLE